MAKALFDKKRDEFGNMIVVWCCKWFPIQPWYEAVKVSKILQWASLTKRMKSE